VDLLVHVSPSKLPRFKNPADTQFIGNYRIKQESTFHKAQPEDYISALAELYILLFIRFTPYERPPSGL